MAGNNQKHSDEVEKFDGCKSVEQKVAASIKDTTCNEVAASIKDTACNEVAKEVPIENKDKKQLVAENMCRMNYLLQLSRFMESQGNNKYFSESSSLGSLAASIGRKCLHRISPELKRQFCKGCGSSLVPSVSAKCRLRKNRQKHLVVTCLKCHTLKRFITNPNYSIWSEKSDANV